MEHKFKGKLIYVKVCYFNKKIQETKRLVYCIFLGFNFCWQTGMSQFFCMRNQESSRERWLRMLIQQHLVTLKSNLKVKCPNIPFLPLFKYVFFRFCLYILKASNFTVVKLSVQPRISSPQQKATFVYILLILSLIFRV